MSRSRSMLARGFTRATLAWLAPVLLVLLACYPFMTRPPDRLASGWNLLAVLLGWTGLVLPLAAFAGGVAAHALERPRSVVVKAATLALFSYGLLAYGSPVAGYWADLARGHDPYVSFPVGPGTPGDLLALRSMVEAFPPDSYRFSVDHPLQRPPNWLTYLIHSPAAIAAFTILSALLGLLTAGLTTGLSPPARFNARWASGMACGFSFLVFELPAGDWVRADLSNSGVFAAWGPLIVPLLILTCLSWVARRRGVHSFLLADLSS